MKLNFAQSARTLLVAGFALMSLFVSSEDSDAQSLLQVRTDYGRDNQIQYAPDDPTTRSRLFTLHTGHAGAFYNCDGEECKRNSPYICWKTAHGDRMHRTFWDVLQWDRDRLDIAQRICDGGCCATKTAKTRKKLKTPCGCPACAGQGVATTMYATKAPSSSSSLVVAKKKLPLTSKANVVGLVGTGVGRVKSSLQTQRSSVAGSKSVLSEKVVCDCLNCNAKQQDAVSNKASVSKKAAALTVDKAPVARSASLLERARSTRQR